MADKYFVSDGHGAKEVEIPAKQDPFKSILAKDEGHKTSEKAAESTESPLAAGDALKQEYTDSFGVKEESVVVEPKSKEEFNCRNCQRRYSEDEVRKEPIDWIRNEDGTLSKSASRFSVFCKVCGYFFRVLDNNAAKMLQDMIRKNVKN